LKYGIFSDIHSNLEALDKVLEELDRQKVDYYVCLGDIVGYGVNPNECVEKVKEVANICVAGNHDYGVLGKANVEYFSGRAKEVVQWTQKVLKKENMEYLTDLPLVHRSNGNFFVHASPRDPDSWIYLITLSEGMLAFVRFQEKICFVGHSHYPITFTQGKDGYGYFREETFVLDEETRYIVNVGSVGQPRDQDPRAACTLYDSDTREVKIIRVSYDLETTQRKIRDAGLPPSLADRLSVGE
jgi:diadenosine tetraphosphatase ApaH/serine/threonine PP2A family protein phosphatase